MKDFAYIVLETLLVITALTAFSYGQVSEGLVNVVLFWAWVKSILIAVGGSNALNKEEKLIELAEKLKRKGTSALRAKVTKILSAVTGVTFIWWGYWFTGGMWFISLIITLVLVEKVKELNKDEPEL